MLARLLVPLDVGKADSPTSTWDVSPFSATLELNGHDRADTLEFECAWGDIGIDPRFARNAYAEFYMGDAISGQLSLSRETYRFSGIADKIERVASDSGQVARLSFRDFTASFIEMKPFPAEGIPSYSSTLYEAWQKICDYTGFRQRDGSVQSSVKVLRDRIRARGGADIDRPLKSAVSSRLSKVTQVQVKDKADAWAVWQQCVGMCGLISFIDRDECIVTTTADQFAFDPGATPRLVWGSNILEMTETAIGKRDAKGVILTSYDPLTGQVIEASYNPNTKQKKRRLTAKGRTTNGGAAAAAADYEPFDYFGVTDIDVLETLAERVWMERATQELEGRLSTSEMRIGTDASPTASFDLLSLRSGESIRIDIDPLDEGVFSRFSGDTDRANYLVERGYQPRAAWLLARNAGRLMQLGRTFKVRSSRIHLSTSGDSGEFKVDVTYCNRIEPDRTPLSEIERARAARESDDSL